MTLVTLTLNFRPFLNCMEADDPELIRELKENIVSPPSTLPYNFTQVQHRRDTKITVIACYYKFYFLKLPFKHV
jgi:hypothetical protein